METLFTHLSNPTHQLQKTHKHLRQNIQRIYSYYDEQNTLLYQAIRYKPTSYNKKPFAQRRLLPSQTYIWGLSDGLYKKDNLGDFYLKQKDDFSRTHYTHLPAIPRRIPYHLSNILHNQLICLVEGEKDVETLEYFDYCATTNVGGAHSFSSELVQYFHNKDVVIFKDNDVAGERSAQKKALLLYPVVKSLKIVEQLPGITQKGGDITDYVFSFDIHPDLTRLLSREKKHIQHHINRLITQQEEYTPPPQSIVPHTTHSKIYPKIPSQYTVSEILSHFHKCTELHQNQWIACCPSHPDNNPSLSIKYDSSGQKLLFHCFAGCSTESIISSIGLEMKDLFQLTY